MKTSTPADLILHNGRITTLDSKCPEATNLAVKNGRILGVNDAEEYQPGPNTKVIDLKGRRAIARRRIAKVEGAGAANAARTMGARGRWLERISICRTPDADAG